MDTVRANTSDRTGRRLFDPRMPDNVETVALEEEQYAAELNISNASYGAASYYYRNLRHPNNYSADLLLQERRQIALSQ
jgi:hypothetical protein